MDIIEAYKHLGLQPLDTYIQGVLDQTPGATRRLGASTWLCVSAALAVMQRKHVLLVGKSLAEAEEFGDRCRSYVSTLDGIQLFKKEYRKWIRPKGGVIEWTSERILNHSTIGRPVEIFNDREWALKAYAKTQGPYREIEKITRTPEGKYLAYDCIDNFLVELTQQGAIEIAGTSWKVMKEGW